MRTTIPGALRLACAAISVLAAGSTQEKAEFAGRVLDEHGIVAPLRRFLTLVAEQQGMLHVSLDVDFLDPAYAPGTGTPVVGGFSTQQAMDLIRGLGGLNVIGMDVVEVSPPYDHSEITALAAASVAQELLAAYAART